MNLRNAFWIAGAAILGLLVIGTVLPPGRPSKKQIQRLNSYIVLRQLASRLIIYATDHGDNFPPSFDGLTHESVEDYGFNTEAMTHHSYIATKDRRHLIVFERPGLWDDHTVAYLDLNTSGNWAQLLADESVGAKFNRVTEGQFAEYAARVTAPAPTQSSIDKLIADAGSGDAQGIKGALDEGAPINAEDSRGWTALTAAAQEGQSGIIDLLISKGARLDARDHFAVGRTALMRACALGRTNIVETLLAHHAGTRVKREDGSNALTDALPYPAIVAKLMAAGADGNEQLRPDWSPLIAACSEGYAESVGILIQHGADLNRDGIAAVDAASRSGSAEAIAMLLTKGLRVSRKVLGQCLSSAYCHPQAMAELLAAGADPNAKCTCPGGRTPLMISALNGCPETVDLLIKAGADLNAKDDNGHTALDLMLADQRTGWMDSTSTEKSRLSEIVDTLRNSGAKKTGSFVEWPEPR